MLSNDSRHVIFFSSGIWMGNLSETTDVLRNTESDSWLILRSSDFQRALRITMTELEQKKRNFTIESILQRGASGSSQASRCPPSGGTSYSRFLLPTLPLLRETNDHFDWISCTRYNPPRLQREFDRSAQDFQTYASVKMRLTWCNLIETFEGKSSLGAF